VDEATEPIAAPDVELCGFGWRFPRVGRDELERSVWPLSVVVVDVYTQDAFEVAPV
jgi:hypothetical protein